ncbi:MAG: peptidylprolyl isomerase [Dehalococcoidia bacterium]|nr:peptidylprolyl isomerase [Dehalococcoidia bacterium]
MAKKQKKATPEQTPTKHQLSKWQRQMKIRRIVIIAAVVFLVGISSWVGYGYYRDYRASTAAWREVMIEVNGVPFTMEYFAKILNINVVNYVNTIVNSYVDIYIQLYNITREEAIQQLASDTIADISANTNNITDMLADNAAHNIIDAELLRQGAEEELGIEVTSAEINAALEARELPNDKVYQDIIRGALLEEKVRAYFGAGVNATVTMPQAHAQVMLVESQEVATGLITQIEAGGNFTALAEQFSCNSTVEGDLGWLPEELMPNTLIANAAFGLAPGNTSQPIYDGTAIKDVGYWLIEVTGSQNETINAQVMLLGSQAEAEWVKGQLADGGNFSALAGNYSQHGSKTKGGKLDGLKPGDTGSAAFDQVAFNMTLNQVSEPVKDTSVQTTGGYWLVMLIDRAERELEEATREQLIDKRYNDWREAWADKGTIETYLEPDKISWALNQVLAGL